MIVANLLKNSPNELKLTQSVDPGKKKNDVIFYISLLVVFLHKNYFSLLDIGAYVRH